ncbi:tRNA (adenosine(37)-N6)-dimethylallyltransferase MiaA [Pseudooctadecabacter jejudonensis]|uniref:tRNA dimethylallyltransferase n=1 Tax=Pseudooctadecabacter jejudonensis TaxID=1391910 RepID=A0A1Y5RGX6_9RHOB|nr:tRNA (adenosine(37)-N6)-dimethylallyltransferase MiaA [Pseudooctadecabacter jejudonensis]SLN16929.1 tRNA dimethylallyltransferase [Pseudooctadecabacter jejudonensis]
MIDLSEIEADKPVLIFGPTASGKSGLALHIAKAQGGVILNADTLQAYEGWPILTAQPPAEDLAQAPHHLYGHLTFDAPTSVGDWLRDVAPFLADHAAGGPRPIIVGGTGLYFTALTEGLADIPPTPDGVRARANAIPLPDLIADLDADTAAHIDLANRARVQRAWEVQSATGQSIRHWQAQTPPALLPLKACTPLALLPDVDWLGDRITRRFDQMMDMGAAEEARAMLPRWDPKAPSSKAIGAAEMIEFVQGRRDADSLKSAVVVATRQYAKRQRTWLRSRMKRWRQLALPDVADNRLST